MSEAELKDLYQAHTARASDTRSTCPTPDELAGLVTDQTSQDERERIADHLIVCSDCAQQVRLLETLRSRREEIIVDPARAGERTVREAGMRKEGRARGGFGLQSATFPLALAASVLLVMAVAALGWQSRRLHHALAENDRALTDVRQRFAETARQAAESDAQVARLRQSLDTLSQPQLNIPVVDLDPRDAFRGAPQRARKTVDVPAGAGVITLILNVVGDLPYSRYGLDIVDSADTLVWSGQGLEKGPLNTFTVALPRPLIHSGRYRIKLYGLGDSGRHLIEDYALQLQVH